MSRACYCASGLMIMFGLALTVAGVIILYHFSIEQPNSEQKDLWLVLVLLLAAGVALVVLGNMCCGCASVCSTNNSIGCVSDDEERILRK